MVSAPRYPLEFPVTIHIPKGEFPVLAGSSENLSESGMKLKFLSKPPFTQGDQLMVLLHYGDEREPHERLAIRSQVVWVRDRTVGLQIRELPKEGMLFYQTLLDGFQVLMGFTPVGHLEFD